MVTMTYGSLERTSRNGWVFHQHGDYQTRAYAAYMFRRRDPFLPLTPGADMPRGRGKKRVRIGTWCLICGFEPSDEAIKAQEATYEAMERHQESQ